MNIYEYEKASDFLHDLWLVKKDRNPSFSLRSWAKRLGMSSNAPLSLMLQGKRSIAKKYVPMMADDLELSKDEQVYLEALIEFNKAKDEDTKEYYYKLLESLNPENKVNFIQIEHSRMHKNPLHFVLLEIFSFPEAKADPKWLQEHLTISATIPEIKECVNRLEELGLIKITNEKVEKFEGHFNTTVDVPDTSLMKLHQRCSDLAKEVIETTPVNEREFNVTYISIDKEKVGIAKEKLRSFISDFLEEFDTKEKNKNATYQLNTQLFELFKLQ